MPQQDIARLGYNVAEFKKETQIVLEQMQSVVAAIAQIDEAAKNIGNFGAGIKDFKQAAEQLTKTQAELAKQNNALNKSLVDQAKVREANAKAAKAEIAAENEVIKQIDLEAKAQERLEKQAKKTADAKAKAAEVPFTSNLNNDGTIQEPTSANTTGSVVNDAELAATQAQLDAQAELQASIKKTEQVYTEADATTAGYVETLANQNEAIDKNISELESYAQILAENNKSLEEIAPATELFVGNLEKNQTALANIKQDLANNKAAQASLNAEMQASAVITAEQEAAMNALKAEEIALNKEAKSFTTTIQLQIKEFTAEAGSIEQLRARLTNLQNAYEKLSADQRTSGIGIQLKKQIDLLEPEVKKAEGTIGKFQRNVGNYSSAIGKGFKNAFSYIRTAANILPGIGIAGLFGLAIDGITKLTIAILNSNKALDAYKEKIDDINEAFKDNSVKSAAENIERLRVAVDSAKNGLLDKEKVVKEYNDSLGATLGTAKDFNDVEDKMSDEKRLNAYVKAMLYRAAANLALQKAADAALKAEEDRRKKSDEFATIGNRAGAVISSTQTAPGFVPGLNDLNAQMKARSDAAKKAQDEAVKQSEDAQKKQEDIAKSFFSDIDKLTKEFNLNFNPLGDPHKTGEKVKKTIDVAYEIAKNELERQIKELQDFVDKGSPVLFNQRYAAADELAKKEEELSKLMLQNEIKNGKAKVVAQQENSFRIIDINKKLSDNLIKITNDRYTKEADIPAPAIDDSLQKQIEAQKRVNDHLNNIIKAAGQDRANIIAQAQSEANTKLNEQYSQGLITYEQYEKGKRDVAIKYSKEAIEALIQTANAELAIAKQADPNSDKVRELTAQIAKLKEQLSDLGVSAKTTGLADLQSVFEKIAEGVNNVTQALSAINNISYDNQKAQLEEIQAQQEKNYEQEVNNINNSTLSEEEKANKLKILDSQRAAQQEAISRKQRQADNAKARFDKEVGIMSIIVNTAAAVVKALPVIPLAIAVGALGAAELAAAVATKVPSYKYGLHSDKPDHVGIYGEAGYELIDKPGQDPFITNTPTLDFIPRGTRIKPLATDDVNEILHKRMLRNLGNYYASPKEKKQDVIDVNALGDVIAKNMKKQKRPYVKVVNNIGEDLNKLNYIRKHLL